MKFLQTRKGKIVMNFVYGIGAAVVIVGAWGKILHKPWANMAITVGLLTEALIFTISAFEPPHEDVDWSLVYPELAGMAGHGGDNAKAIDSGDSVTQELDKLLGDAKIGPELIESLGDGMRKLSDSTQKLSTIGDAAEANTTFVTNIKAAASNVSKLSDSYIKAADSLTGISIEDGQNYGEQLQKVSKNLSALNSTYELQIQGSKEYAETSSKAFSGIKDMLQHLSQSVDGTKRYKEEIDVIGQNLASLNTTYSNMLAGGDGQNYGEQLSKVSKNLTALNSVYELQIQGSKEYVESSAKAYGNINEMLQHLSQSVEDTKRYKEEIHVLGQNLAALNSVYGNMLSAMNFRPNA